MEVISVQENDDGSSDYRLNLSEDEQSQLIRFGLMAMLMRVIEEGKVFDPQQQQQQPLKGKGSVDELQKP